MVVLSVLLFGALLLNMASAGVAALLAIKRPGTGLGRRTTLASAATGTVTVLILAGAIMEGMLQDGETGAVVSGVVAVLILGSALVCAPGALVMGRLAQRPPPVGDTFD